jgi:hypothetical protein
MRRTTARPIRITLLTLAALGVLAGPAAAQRSDVNVVNSPQNAVPVTPVSPEGWELFQQTASLTNTIDVSVFTVPADKRLVIEFVSGFCNAGQNVPVHTVRLSGSVDHFLTPSVFPTGPGTSFAVITQLARIYVRPSAVVKLAAFPTRSTSTTTCTISLSGYLETP